MGGYIFYNYASNGPHEYFPTIETIKSKYPEFAFCSLNGIGSINIKAVCHLPNNVIYPYLYFIIMILFYSLFAFYVICLSFLIVAFFCETLRRCTLKIVSLQFSIENEIIYNRGHFLILLLLKNQLNSDTFEQLYLKLASGYKHKK